MVRSFSAAGSICRARTWLYVAVFGAVVLSKHCWRFSVNVYAVGRRKNIKLVVVVYVTDTPHTCLLKIKNTRQPFAYWPMAEVEITSVTPTPSSTTIRPALWGWVGTRVAFFVAMLPRVQKQTIAQARLLHIPCNEALGAQLVLVTRLAPDIGSVDGGVAIHVGTLFTRQQACMCARYV